MDYKIIGKRIKEYRKNAGMTQAALGKAVERSESSIAKYEKGEVEIPYSILQEIAKNIGADTSYLLYGNYDPTPEESKESNERIKTWQQEFNKALEETKEEREYMIEWGISPELYNLLPAELQKVDDSITDIKRDRAKHTINDLKDTEYFKKDKQP